jgi:hypothetical protein
MVNFGVIVVILEQFNEGRIPDVIKNCTEISETRKKKK